MSNTQAPPALEQHHKSNFNQLQRAFKHGDIALVSSIRKSDNQPVALVCAMQYNDDETITPVPFAVMVEGNPYEDFVDPTLDD